MNSEELKSALTERGYRISSGQSTATNECDWYAYRRTGLASHPCETNDDKSDQVVVRPWITEYTPLAVEIEATSEIQGIWIKVQAYGLDPDEVVARLPEIERRLIGAWNGAALSGVKAETVPRTCKCNLSYPDNRYPICRAAFKQDEEEGAHPDFCDNTIRMIGDDPLPCGHSRVCHS